MSEEPLAPPRLIKRYANRKLYDTERSAYVTLEEIAEMVKAGDDIQIVDNRSGEDLTGVTLTQIIYEDQKKPDASSGLPLSALRGIIQQGGEMFAKIKGAREKLEEESQAAVRELVDNTHRVIETRQKAIDTVVKDTFTQMTHYGELEQRLDTIDANMARLDAQLQAMTVPSCRQRRAPMDPQPNRMGTGPDSTARLQLRQLARATRCGT